MDVETRTTIGTTREGERSRLPPSCARRKVLILRSCRPAQFDETVRDVRRRHPAAEVVALSHRGHLETLRRAGVDRTIEIGGKRFGLMRLWPTTVWKLRRERFDEIVVPQMSRDSTTHVNLYWLVLALRPGSVTIFVPGDGSRTFEPLTAFRGFTFWNTILAFQNVLDAPAFLVLLLAACAVRRPTPVPGARRRVLLVISSLGVGGAQVQLGELLNRLPGDRYDVDLLVLGKADGAFSARWLNRPDVSISYLEHWPQLAASVWEIRARCLAARYDLVHSWLFMANVMAVPAARLAGVPVVIASVRNLSVWKRTDWYRKWWFRAADVLSSRAASLVTVNARALVDDHARWALLSPSRISVVHNGLDPVQLTASPVDGRGQLLALTGAAGNSVFVGTVGRLAPEKDQQTFLRLLALVRRVRADVHGVLIGDGELRSRLEALANELGLTGSVTFLGERADARPLMAGFDVFVLTSLCEGFPNVLLEATFLGVPALATPVGGNPDVLDTPESIFAAGDAAAGAAQVLAMLADPAGTQVRQQQLRQRAAALFSAERSVAAWLALYDRCFEQTAPAAAPIEVLR